MNHTRRDFMRLLGITLASLLLTRCGKFVPGEQTPRERLRAFWLQFDELANRTRATRSDQNDLGQQMISGHGAALDELVAGGDITAPGADLVQEAYAAAVYHVWRSNAPITCYAPMMVDFAPMSANTLVQQSEILGEIAQKGTLDPKTLENAQAALEKDMAFYALSDEETQGLYQRMMDEMQMGGPYPSFNELELEMTPEAREAARFIFDLLSKE